MSGIVKSVRRLKQPNDFSCDALENEFETNECLEKCKFRVTEKDGQTWYLCKKHYDVYMVRNKEKVDFT